MTRGKRSASAGCCAKPAACTQGHGEDVQTRWTVIKYKEAVSFTQDHSHRQFSIRSIRYQATKNRKESPAFHHPEVSIHINFFYLSRFITQSICISPSSPWLQRLPARPSPPHRFSCPVLTAIRTLARRSSMKPHAFSMPAKTSSSSSSVLPMRAGCPTSVLALPAFPIRSATSSASLVFVKSFTVDIYSDWVDRLKYFWGLLKGVTFHCGDLLVYYGLLSLA
ncbi:hypothetical protein B0H66DRAFT_589232 [Apodospora peruviana]|uniref:Uncharacterized protein n=1 Tax=Apodospora peruviana TaxID=516989 RepID=A0AAE0IK62_9PEZI|nr:hypothetical protein B0H66DRAFT_589232 [Apodospora peruviana]